MTAPRSVALLVVVALVGVAVAPVASGSLVAEIGGDDQPNERDESETNRGQDVTTFMHTSTTDTENTVESEMFEARYENADNDTQTTLVDDRADGLATKLESLENERDELRDRKDELSQSEYQARMTRLTVEITALERSIERTKPLAADTNVGINRLQTIHQSAAELAGQQIAEIARGLAGFDRSPGNGNGPFHDHVPGNGERGEAGDDTLARAAPGDGERERGNESARDETGPNSATENDETPPALDTESETETETETGNAVGQQDESPGESGDHERQSNANNAASANDSSDSSESGG